MQKGSRARHDMRGDAQPDLWMALQKIQCESGVCALPLSHMRPRNVLNCVLPLKGINTAVGNLGVCLILEKAFEAFITSAALCSHFEALFLK